MQHGIYRVTACQKTAPFTLRVAFDDATEQVIDFRPVLRGNTYGPLRDPKLFDQVRIDTEAWTLVWPNGADFDPADLHDWPEAGRELAERAREW